MYLIAACAMSYSEKSIIIINESNINAIAYCKGNGNFLKLLLLKISIQSFHHYLFGLGGEEYMLF